MKQLNGKTVAISDASGNSTLLFGSSSPEWRCRRNRAVAGSRRAVGAVGVLGGAVDATMITIGMARQAQAKGFRILAYSGDYVSAPERQQPDDRR